MRIFLRLVSVYLVLLPAVAFSQPQPAVISVDLAHPGAAISPQMYGIFFEDINFAADGGLYPELVKNRSFEFSEPLTGWHEILPLTGKGMKATKGELAILTDKPLNASNPHYLEARVHEAGGYGFYNTGFRGMGIHEGADYRFSAYVRTGGKSGGPKTIRAEVVDGRNVIASGKLEGFTGEWTKFETVIHASATADHAQLNLYVDDLGISRSRHGLAVPGGHVEGSAEWAAQGYCSVAGRHASGVSSIPGRVHCGGAAVADALSLEDNSGRPCRPQDDHQPVER